MSRRAAGFLLWAVLFATLPLPFYLGASGREPPLGIAFLALLAGGIWWTEGGGGTTGLLAGLALGQALAAMLATGLLARLGVRALWTLAPRRAPWAVALLCGGLVALSLLPIYTTPLSSRSARSNLLGLFR